MLASIAVIISLIGYYQYFKTMFAGKTKPHMFSWVIWAVLTAIAFFAQISDNAGAGSWITGLAAFLSFFIAGYAYFYGEKVITKGDWLTFLCAISAIPIWLITNDALLAVLIITVIDALGFYPTFRKSWNKPYEENITHSFLSAVKFILAVMALDNTSIITALYPISLIFMNLIFVAFVIWRRIIFDKNSA